jgi:hypothetical protein
VANARPPFHHGRSSVDPRLAKIRNFGVAKAGKLHLRYAFTGFHAKLRCQRRASVRLVLFAQAVECSSDGFSGTSLRRGCSSDYTRPVSGVENDSTRPGYQSLFRRT